ncbi:MAG TPA: MaoC/PaaZ C-terminal domain-containing protein [Acidimicrobiales bacterium]|jgi:acyl dehydratase|nr:MaoC/PaaZ C-terminal domain-containing protein [Acidimicrobiales bacterium]
MPINPDAVGTTSERVEFSWDSDACLLYALGVGAGMTDPTGFELEFTTENSQDITQRALPTMAVVLGLRAGARQGGTTSALGTYNPAMLVHGEQGITLHQPLPVAGVAVSQSRIAAIYDKGKAAVVVMEATTEDKATGSPLFTTTTSMFIRGEGGWGGDRGPSSSFSAPDRAPDHVVTYETRADQALLYRLNGDRNPLHSDPKFAALGGFPKPILHGLCTYGFTGRALLHAVCGSDPDRFLSMHGRFASPVMPGETLEVRIWVDGKAAAFQTYVGDRCVLDAGQFTFA